MNRNYDERAFQEAVTNIKKRIVDDSNFEAAFVSQTKASNESAEHSNPELQVEPPVAAQPSGAAASSSAVSSRPNSPFKDLNSGLNQPGKQASGSV